MTQQQYAFIGKTNYFSVTDVETLQKLAREAKVEISEKEGKFALFSPDDWIGEQEKLSLEAETFWENLQSILSKGEAVVYSSLDQEKLNGYVRVVTRDAMKVVDLVTVGLVVARLMLENPDFEFEVNR